MAEAPTVCSNLIACFKVFRSDEVSNGRLSKALDVFFGILWLNTYQVEGSNLERKAEDRTRIPSKWAFWNIRHGAGLEAKGHNLIQKREMTALLLIGKRR